MLKKSKLYLVFLILFSLIPLFDFFRPGLPVTHDGQDHVARVANFCQSFSEGNLVPRWAANLNWGYGHPILMFLYPLPSYVACLFHFSGFSLVSSVKIVFGLSFVLSGVFMYLWLKEIWGEKAGFMAGLIYMFAPYRFVDLYVRGAIGECWAFVWLPLICWFILKLSKQIRWRYLVGGSLSLAALILSHNALSLMFLLVVVGYALFLIYQAKKKLRLAVWLALVVVFGLMIAGFFWIPAFFEGKYTLRNIVTKGNVTGFESFSRLLWSPWSYGGTGSLSVQVGILQWLGVILAPWLIWKFLKKKDKIWIFLLFLFVYFWSAIFMMTLAASFLYFKISLLQKFQFAWRFLSLAIFPPAIFMAALIFILPKKFKLLILSLLLLAGLLLNKNYWRAKDFSFKKEVFYTQVYPGTTDTGESAPRWSVRFMEKFPQSAVEVIEGKGEVKQKARTSTRHEFEVLAYSPVRLVDNTLYFPGWQVLVSTKGGPRSEDDGPLAQTSGRDGQPVKIQFQDPDYRGLMTFDVPVGEHQVIVRFRETKFRQFANLISLAGLAGLALVGVVLKWRTAR